MMKRSLVLFRVVLAFTLLFGFTQAQAEKLRPYNLGITPVGGFSEVVKKTESNLKAQGFRVVGSYGPYPDAWVICVTNNELLSAASKATNGGFGAVMRATVTQVEKKLADNTVVKKIQVAYLNPTYIGTAYGMGKLESVAKKLEQALGFRESFGAEGLEPDKLAPGKYHYAMLMPYFKDVSLLNRFSDYKTAVTTVERNLGAGRGGTLKVYRVDIPGKEVSVFGVGIPVGDGLDKGSRDTDKEVMDIIDHQELRSTPYLPYEMMVQGEEVIALPGRYRIAVHFPDTKMAGKHGFTKIMSSPRGIKKALEAASGYDSSKGGFSIDQE